MSMPTSPTRLLTCNACGATLPFEPEHAGMKCRCGGCGKILIVPGEKEEEEKDPGPRYVSFVCQVCQTILSARVEHVGRKAKCPDCYALTEVPPPPKAKKKRIPDAMHGQQYGLWGVDEAPSSKELTARLPKFFPVYCRLCNTLMHAQPKQVGMKLKCPDCGVKTLVVEPPPERPAASVMVPDGEEYQIDEAAAPPERPAYAPPKVRELTELEKHEASLRQEYYERPVLPRFPLVEGVFRMLLRRPLPEAVFALAFALALELWFIANAMANVTGMALAIVLLSYAVTAVFGLLSLMAASAFWLAVLKESSEGNDRLYNPPDPVFLDWAGECFYVVFAGAMSVAPGLLLWRFIPPLQQWVWAGPVAAAASWLVLFPLFLLSQLENGSPMEFFSPKLASTLFKHPGQWLLFYSEVILGVGSSAAAIYGLTLLSPWLLVGMVLIAAAMSFLYFRLLGRLAWWLAESIPVDDEEED